MTKLSLSFLDFLFTFGSGGFTGKLIVFGYFNVDNSIISFSACVLLDV